MQEIVCFQTNCIRQSRHSALNRQCQNWGAMHADLVKRTGLGRQETKVASLDHIFIMNLRGAAARGSDVVDGHPIAFKPRHAGSVIYIPAGTDWTGWDEGDATASYLLVSIDRNFAEDTFAGAKRHRLPRLAPSIGFRDCVVEMALQRIAMEVTHPDPLSAVMAESQAMQLFVQMLRLNGMPPQVAKGGLSGFQLRRALEMIEAPDKTVTLTDLANELGVSRFHLWRSFKQSTGATPRALAAKRRLEKSSQMLRATALSATEIAMECNFSSSSHFSTAFKLAFGVTPTEYRRLSRI